jgi:uncharacterized protein
MYISSPCIKNCCLDEDDICMGCFRHANEITDWQKANSEKKQRILVYAEQRKQQKLRLKNE